MSTTNTAPSDGMARLLEHNPLGVGLVALIIGAVVGLLLPETERENQLMGATRDQFVDKAHDAAVDLRTKVGTIAGVAQSAATDALHTVQDSATEALNTVKGSATEALNTVKDTVTEEVKHQGLVPEQG